MEQYISKSAVLAEIDKVMAEEMKFYETACKEGDEEVSSSPMVYTRLQILRSSINSLEMKEVDINKLCEFRENIGFAYPEGASEYQKQLACYRQGIKDVIKAQKGEKV